MVAPSQMGPRPPPPRPITTTSSSANARARIAPTCPLPPGITTRTFVNLSRVIPQLTEMINAAYAAGEQGLWPPDTPRVFDHEVQEMVDREELLFAYRDG